MRSLIGGFLIAAVPFHALAEVRASEPSLTIQITVDGLRGDLISRYQDSFGTDGFVRLIENSMSNAFTARAYGQVCRLSPFCIIS